METIEERAKAFCENNICVDCGDRKNCDRGCVGCCIPTFSALEWLIQFGKSEHTGLTRWHDPKEPPEPGRVVLVKRNPSSIIPYDLGHIDNDGNWVDSWCGSPIDDKIMMGQVSALTTKTSSAGGRFKNKMEP